MLKASHSIMEFVTINPLLYYLEELAILYNI